MSRKKIIIYVGIIVSIPFLIFGGMIAFYSTDNYLEKHYCIKGGGIYYDEMLDTCAYEIQINGTTAVYMPGHNP